MNKASGDGGFFFWGCKWMKWKSLLLKAVYILIQPLFLPLAFKIDFSDSSWVFYYSLAACLYILDAALLLVLLGRK